MTDNKPMKSKLISILDWFAYKNISFRFRGKQRRISCLLLSLLILFFCCCPLSIAPFLPDSTPAEETPDTRNQAVELDETLEATPTLTVIPTDTSTPEPTDTPTITPTSTKTPTPTITLTPSITPTSTNTPTPRPTNTPQPTNTPAPTNTPVPPPQPVGSRVQITRVDKREEYVTLTNTGDAPQSLDGWTLVSEKGNQQCGLYGVLNAGQSINVYALASDAGLGGINCGMGSNIWNNSEPDPAVLYDSSWQEMDRY